MRPSRWCWGLLLVCWPLAVWAGDAALRVKPLAAPPSLAADAPAAPIGGTPAVATRAWLRAPHAATALYELRLARDWHHESPPLLVIHGNTRARVTAYLPPDYAAHRDTVFDATLDPTFSHHAVVYPLPAALRADQPIYLTLGDPGQTQPIRLSITDTASYRAHDLGHVRASTFFSSVQVSMVLVILCFWVVLHDRMFLYFVGYVGAQAAYATAASGELFALPGAVLLTPLGYHTGQSMAALAAAFSIWFILEFAALRSYTPRLAAWLGALRWPFLALTVLVWIPLVRPDDWLPNTVNLLLIASTAIVLAASWLAWRRGNRQAGYFLLAWVPVLALTLARVVQLIAGWPLPTWLEYGFPASMAYATVVITAGLADRTLQVRRERDHATRMAQFDPLTGVLNRRAIMDRLEEVWHAATDPLAALFLDIDHCKQINDGRGNAAGDACLGALVGTIRAELGESDHVGRYGGEEFLIVLHGASARVAPRVAERVVARVAALRVPVGEDPVQFTVSIGVASRDAGVAGFDALVEYADAAQYRAKAAGRNRVVVWRRAAPATVLAGAQ